MEQGNRTAGGASLTSGFDSRVVPVTDADKLIAVKDSNVTTEISWIRQGDFDAARHYLLSEEEQAMVGQPRSRGGGCVVWEDGVPR